MAVREGVQVAGDRVDLFISYADSDRAWAKWAAWHLDNAGYSVELDLWDWAAGDNVVLRMNDVLARADRMLAVWSAAYFQRDRFTTDEWTAVMARRPHPDGGRDLIPVRLEPVAPPPLLASLNYHDVYGMDEPATLAALLEAVRGPSRPTTAPGFPDTGQVVPAGGPPLPATPGALLWRLPDRNPHFTGRVDQLDELATRLDTGSAPVVVQALHGMGGVGKTQTAIEYAHRHSQDYDLIVWIDGEQPTLCSPSIHTIRS